ncbi:hypothetical protein B0H10DRAFT_2281815 [Mycena sp. CBHHK59/15]|nr:hypothetical protein B0H10DRAFT_2281815 [Mycena sp. CBHHK59/15]
MSENALFNLNQVPATAIVLKTSKISQNHSTGQIINGQRAKDRNTGRSQCPEYIRITTAHPSLPTKVLYPFQRESVKGDDAGGFRHYPRVVLVVEILIAQDTFAVAINIGVNIRVHLFHNTRVGISPTQTSQFGQDVWGNQPHRPTKAAMVLRVIKKHFGGVAKTVIDPFQRIWARDVDLSHEGEICGETQGQTRLQTELADGSCSSVEHMQEAGGMSHCERHRPTTTGPSPIQIKYQALAEGKGAWNINMTRAIEPSVKSQAQPRESLNDHYER